MAKRRKNMATKEVKHNLEQCSVIVVAGATIARATIAVAILEQRWRKLSINTCMRKDRSVVFQFDPEIERTVRRLRREQRNSKTISDMDNLQDVGNLDPHEQLQPVNIQEKQNEHVNRRQLGNNNIIYMENDRDGAIRDYVVLTPQVVHPGIIRPEVEAVNFELKPMMFQMLQTVGQFNGLPNEDPHLNLKLFLELETFYNGLNPSTRLMVDASTNEALLFKSYTEAYEILERIANNNYQWPSTKQPAVRGAAGVHNIYAITALLAQVTSLTNMIKATTSAPAAVKQVAKLSCVYCGEEHKFDNCPRNLASVNYVSNYNRQSQNNPYSNTYNLEWKQHPNFLWSNQNQNTPTLSGQNRNAQPLGFHPQNQGQKHTSHNPLISLETLIEEYIAKNEAIVQSQAISVTNLKNQIAQLATTMSSRF
ncbi:hypothetical protein KPL70_003294 [Citrus sinensis]|nr:hypothetical protein KPL70_003294 [Citrus sinensis]